MQLSEIRFVRVWGRGALSRVPLEVFGADKFLAFVEGAPKRYGRRPGGRENAFILNRDLDLQPLALVAWIDRRSIIRKSVVGILFCIPCYRFLRGLIIEQPVTLHQVQSLGVRRPVPVEHGEWADHDTHGVYHQRVAFVMADGVAVPRWRYVR